MVDKLNIEATLDISKVLAGINQIKAETYKLSNLSINGPEVSQTPLMFNAEQYTKQAQNAFNSLKLNLPKDFINIDTFTKNLDNIDTSNSQANIIALEQRILGLKQTISSISKDINFNLNAPDIDKTSPDFKERFQIDTSKLTIAKKELSEVQSKLKQLQAIPQTNIKVKAIFDEMEADRSIKELQSRIQRQKANLIVNTNAETVTPKVVALQARVIQLQRAVGILRTQYMAGTISANQYALAQQKLVVATNKLNAAMGKPAFAGYALSLMFFGMAIQRTLTQIYKTSTKIFQDVRHSVEGVATATDMLDGSFKYLGFTVGEALDPLAAMLFPIIDALANWISENEELFRVLFLVIGAIGVFLTLGGLLKLAFDGFVGAIGVITPLIEGMGAAFTGVATALGIGILPLLGIIAAAVIVFIALWKSNFGGLQDFFKGTFGVLWEVVKTVFSSIWKIIKNVIDLIVAIFEGDWKKVGELTLNLLKLLTELFLKALMGIGALIVNIMALAWNMVVDLVLKVIIGLITSMQSLFIDGIKWIIEKAATISEKLGLGRGIFDSALKGLDKLKNGILDVQKTSKDLSAKIKIDYVTGDSLAAGFKKVDEMLKTDQPKQTEPVKTSSTTTNTVNYNINVSKIESNNLDDLMKSLKRYGA